MHKYSIIMKRTADAAKSVGNVIADATTPRRGQISRLIFGSENAPADAALEWQLQRCTTAGTATAVTPRALDPASPAAVNKANQNHTTDPTLTAGEIPLSVPLHQRATFHFFAVPGHELIFPGTANYGFAIRTPVISTGTPLVTATVHYEE
jgi:hypothetical protein